VATVCINTPRFGALALEEEAVWQFPVGLVGLPDYRRFARLPFVDPGLPFEWLQSIEDPAFAILVVSPEGFIPDYVVELHPDDLSAIGLSEGDRGDILCIVTVHETLPDMTINLLAPIIVNPRQRLAMQVPLVGTGYALHHPLFPEAVRAGSNAPTE